MNLFARTPIFANLFYDGARSEPLREQSRIEAAQHELDQAEQRRAQEELRRVESAALAKQQEEARQKAIRKVPRLTPQWNPAPGSRLLIWISYLKTTA